MKELLTADEAFPKNQSAELPSADEAFPLPGKPIIAATNPTSSSGIDDFLQNTSVGRVMNAFGTAVKDAGQGGVLGIEPGGDIEKALTEHGIFNNHAKNENDVLKGINEAFIRPAAVAIDTEWRGANALLGSVGAGIQQTSQELFGNAPGVLGEIPAMTEYALMHKAEIPMHLPTLINEGRGVAAIGESESAYFGLKEPTPDESIARQRASEALPEIPELEAPKDIHTLARESSPEIFDKYDELQTTRENLRGQLQDLTGARDKEIGENPPHAEELQGVNDKINELLGKVNNVESRLTKRQASKLEDLRAQQEEIQGRQPKDTAEMETLRSRIQQVDYAMRDVAPEVSKAYREAESQLPKEPEEATSETQETPEIPEANPEKETENNTENNVVPLRESKPIEEQLATINNDVSQKLIAAGRPLEEANAASQLISEHYKSISELGWAKGTPEEIYNKDAIDIIAGKERKVRQAAQGELEQSGALSLKTDTLGFKNWFNNSKVIDSKGAPLVVYHGTRQIIESFDESYSSSSSGTGLSNAIFFSSRPDVAGTYGGYGEGRQTMPVYLALKNPLILDAEGRIWRDIKKDANGDWQNINQISRQAKAEGYDGLIVHHVVDAAHVHTQDADMATSHRKQLIQNYRNATTALDERFAKSTKKEKRSSDSLKWPEYEAIIQAQDALKDERIGTSYAVFKPNQIKSIFNKGEFDPDNPDILFQKARGKIRLATDDAKATITLLKTADASTFIHETGHHFLDEMMRYSKAEDTPISLKKDVETVNKWLGVKEGEEISRKQHEQFARGFERYLMEGTAPSQALANVFAKFKQWLTDIYQTVQKLRAPITDDIRDVFDRLLSSKPEKTVIAPERESAKIIENLHEKQAERTPPEKAAEVGDNIRATVDRIVKTHEPEVHDELQRPSEGTANNAAQVANPPESSSATAVGAAAPIAPEQPSKVNSGGAKTEREGPGVSGNPNGRLGKPESKLVDKAGNIRLDNLNTPEDINEVIRQTANENDNFMGARRGKISDGQVLDLADALGMDSSELSKRKLGEAFNAEQVVAARKLLVQSANNLRNLGLKAAEGAEADLTAYAEARARHMAIQEQVSGITAEAGRALRAFRALEGGAEAKTLAEILKETKDLDLFQLQQEAKQLSLLDTAQKVSKLINDSRKVSYKRMILEYYINALISGPITHLRYSMGNILNALWTPLVEIPAAVGIGKIREIVTGKEVPDRVYLGEAGAQLHGIIQGSKNGLQAAATAWKTGASPALPSEELSPMFAIKTNAIPGAIGRVINIPSKSVAAIHSFFKSIRYEQNIQGLAYRNAMKEGLKEGTEAFTNRIADLANNPSEEMMESATGDALKELFMSPTDYNSFAGKLTSAVNSNLAAKIIMPFMKIGSQITRNAFIERTPLGLLTRDVRGRAFYADGVPAGDMQLAKMATGVALMGGLSALTLEGLATGDGPTEPKQRAVWLLNHRPNSIQVGNITIPYQGLGHLGMLMRFSANMTETAHGWNGEDGTKLAKSFMEGITRSVLDENFMRGLKDMLDALYHPEEYGENYIKQFATNWLPFSVGLSQIARQVDPYHREARDIFDAARAKIPFVSEQLEPKRDVFGEPIPNGGPSEKYQSDPVVQRLESLQTGIGKLTRKITGVQLTDKQFDDYSKLAGRITKMRLNNFVNIPGTANLPSEVQIKTIARIIDSSRESARTIIKMNNPDIIRQAVKNKVDALKKP